MGGRLWVKKETESEARPNHPQLTTHHPPPTTHHPPRPTSRFFLPANSSIVCGLWPDITTELECLYALPSSTQGDSFENPHAERGHDGCARVRVARHEHARRSGSVAPDAHRQTWGHAVGSRQALSRRFFPVARDLPPEYRHHRRRSEEHTSELQSRRDLVC